MRLARPGRRGERGGARSHECLGMLAAITTYSSAVLRVCGKRPGCTPVAARSGKRRQIRAAHRSRWKRWLTLRSREEPPPAHRPRSRKSWPLAGRVLSFAYILLSLQRSRKVRSLPGARHAHHAERAHARIQTRTPFQGRGWLGPVYSAFALIAPVSDHLGLERILKHTCYHDPVLRIEVFTSAGRWRKTRIVPRA
jgi:hypothetical protein